MDLICVEQMNMTDRCLAERDGVIFDDCRVMKNLLDLELVFKPTCNYFSTVQNDIQPFMRKVVATWMLEVCEEQLCENQVFPLAVNFLDRFLCTVTLDRSQLQLAAAVCLLLASKTRQCQSITVEDLSYLSDRSFTTDQIKSWELLVLSKLRWNVTAVTGFDFVEHILQRVSWIGENSNIRRHAHTIVALCYVEPEFILKPGSMLASAAICSALRGLRIPSADVAVVDVCELARLQTDAVEVVIDQIESMISKQTQSVAEAAAPTMPSGVAKSVATPKLITVSDDATGQPETPTDLTDIHF